jgi:hypothetical protein
MRGCRVRDARWNTLRIFRTQNDGDACRSFAAVEWHYSDRLLGRNVEADAFRADHDIIDPHMFRDRNRRNREGKLHGIDPGRNGRTRCDHDEGQDTK